MRTPGTTHGAHHRQKDGPRIKGERIRVASGISGINLGNEQGLARARQLVEAGLKLGLLKPAPPQPAEPTVRYIDDPIAYQRERRARIKAGLVKPVTRQARALRNLEQ